MDLDSNLVGQEGVKMPVHANVELQVKIYTKLQIQICTESW